jgi:hypothetical protein
VLRTRWIMSSMTDAQYAIRASDWKGGARCKSVFSSGLASEDLSGIGEKLSTGISVSVHVAMFHLRSVDICTRVEEPVEAIYIQLFYPLVDGCSQYPQDKKGGVGGW